MPMCLVQPCLEKQTQKLCQWPAGPGMDSRFRFFCQTKGKRTADYHWEHKLTENRMGEETCPTSYGKMVANWDTAPVPSLPCPKAVKCLLTLTKNQSPYTYSTWVWLRHTGSSKPFLLTILLHTTQRVLNWKITDFDNTVPISILLNT